MEQVLQYVKQAHTVLKQQQLPEGEEERGLFLQNVFSELDGYEYRLACSHDGSALLEDFLREASKFQLSVFFDRLAGKYASMSSHRYASHVLETIFDCIGKFLLNPRVHEDEPQETDAGEGVLLSLDRLLLRAYDELKECIVDGIMDPYGSHVWRSLLAVFCRVKGLNASVLAVTEHLMALDMDGQGFRELCFQKHAALFLQSLLDALHKFQGQLAVADLLETIFGRMFFGVDFGSLGEASDLAASSKAQEFWARLIGSDTGSRCAEVMIAVLSALQFRNLYSMFCRGKIVDMARSPSANFALQKLVQHCHNSSQFQLLLEELLPVAGELIGLRRFGVVIKAAEWAAAHECCHDLVLDVVLECFHLKRTVEDKQLLLPLALKLQIKQDSVDVHFDTANTQGCLLLSQLAKFPPETIRQTVDGLLKLHEVDLVALAKHPGASRVLEAFIAGQALSPKALQRFSRQFKGHLISLASDRNGSHVVETLWKASPLAGKNQIMEELVPGKERLESTPQGRLVIRNCRLEQYARHNEDWQREEKAKVTKRAMFADILKDDDPVVEPQPKSVKAKHK